MGAQTKRSLCCVCGTGLSGRRSFTYDPGCHLRLLRLHNQGYICPSCFHEINSGFIVLPSSLRKLVNSNKERKFLGLYTSKPLATNQVLDLPYKYKLLSSVPDECSSYIFELTKNCFHDVKNTKAKIGFINHHVKGSIRFEENVGWFVDEALSVVKFYSLQDIEAGKELFIDYGEEYWKGKDYLLTAEDVSELPVLRQ